MDTYCGEGSSVALLRGGFTANSGGPDLVGAVALGNVVVFWVLFPRSCAWGTPSPPSQVVSDHLESSIPTDTTLGTAFFDLLLLL